VIAMQWFANLRLRSKLMAAFASVVLMTAVLGIFAISRLSTVNDQSTVMASHWMISQRAASDLNAVTGDYRIAELQFVNSYGGVTGLAIGVDNTNLYLASTISGANFICIPDAEFQGDLTSTDAVFLGTSGANKAIRVDLSGNVYSYGVDNATTANAANVRVGASAQLLKSTSTQRVKTDMVSLRGDLAGVDPLKLGSDPASVNPYDVLDVAPTEFQSLAEADDGQRILGFIAENVAETFPWAAEWDEDGVPSSVADRPILAALLQVVKEQQSIITALTARIEALEG